MFIFLIFLHSLRLTVVFFLSFLLFALVHHPAFVWGFPSELDITPVTLQFIRAHPPLSPRVLRMAGPILQNFKMIPCSKCSPVGLKLNAHLCENLNSSLLVCEMMLSHYHQGHGCHLWAFSVSHKDCWEGEGAGWLPFFCCTLRWSGVRIFCLVCLFISPSNPTAIPSVLGSFLFHLIVLCLCHRFWEVIVELIWRAWEPRQCRVI